MSRPIERAVASVVGDGHDDDGTYTLLLLDCGHSKHCNPIFTYRVGERMQCFECGRESESAA